MFQDMFTWMNVGQTRELVLEHTETRKVSPGIPGALTRELSHR
jgi:hypothetical protein